MIGDLIGQLVGAAVASKKRAIGFTITRIAAVLFGVLLLLAGLVFVLVTIYNALTPAHFTRVEAAAIIAAGLLVVGGVLVLVALKTHFKPSAASDKPDPQSAELQAIEALGMLNKALTDMGKNRGGASPYIGLLGIAALVGFVSGRKR
jgi:hypothetical protein